MTNKEDGDGSNDCDPRVTALLAVNVVSQVLDEAYVIANAAKESGQPWRYLSMLKSFKISRLVDTNDEDMFEALKGDCGVNENKSDIVANVVATSTPQKLAMKHVGNSCQDESNSYNDSNLIGQGDEDLEMQQNELTKSTSMFINHLFDMSDVERVAICDDSEMMQNSSGPNNLLVEAMNNIMETYIANTMLHANAMIPLEPEVKVADSQVPLDISRSDNSDYSFLPDAFVADINIDVAFYIDDDNPYKRHESYERYEAAVVEEIKEPVGENTEEMIQKKDVALYENAYVTLNRDYDQCSEDDGYPVLQDPKGMTMQEVELMTANTSDDDLSYPIQEPGPQQQKYEEAEPTVSGVSGSRKKTLARRCRIQGARLLACLRGWWRRKTPGKHKDMDGLPKRETTKLAKFLSQNGGQTEESRVRESTRGLCPLSPDARRRASSLLDNRALRSPSPSRPVVWKFNTVNEAVVNSNRWKDYTFDTQPEQCGEY